MKKFFLIILFLFFLNFVSSVPCTGSQVSDCLSTSPPCINYYENRGGLYYQCGSGSPFCTQSEITCTPDVFDPYSVNLPPWFTNVQTDFPNASAGQAVNFSSIVNDDGLVDVAWFRDNFNSSSVDLNVSLGASSSRSSLSRTNSYDSSPYGDYFGLFFSVLSPVYLKVACLPVTKPSTPTGYNYFLIYLRQFISNSSGILIYNQSLLSSSLSGDSGNHSCITLDSPILLTINSTVYYYFITIRPGNSTDSSNNLLTYIKTSVTNSNTSLVQASGTDTAYIYNLNNRINEIGSSAVYDVMLIFSTSASSGLQNRTSWDLNDAVKGLNVSITMPSIAGNYKYQWCGADTTGLGTNPQNCYNFSYFVNATMTDITNPTISIVSPANNSKTNRDIWIDGIASDNLGLRQVWAEYTIGLGNTTWTNISECQSMDTQLADCHWKLNNNTIYSSGTYVYRLRAFDLAGNTATSIARVLSLDVSLPFVLWFNISYNPFGSKMSIRPGEYVNITLNVSDREGLINNATTNTTGNPYFLNGTNKNMSVITLLFNQSANGTSLFNIRFLVGTSPDGSNLTEYFSYDNATNYLDYFLRILVDNAQPVSTGTSIANQGVIWNNSYVIFTSAYTDNIRLDNWTVQINTSNVWANESTQPFYQQYEETIYWAKLMNQGNYSFRIFAYDDAGNLNVSDNVEFEVRGTEPNLIITNIYPENDAILTTLSNNFTFNYTGFTATNCSLILVNDTASQYNQTISSPAENTSLNFSQINMNSFNDSSFSWETECCLQRGETYCFRDNSQLTINTSYSVPQNVSIEWLYPTINQTIPRNLFTNISINVTCNNENCGNINSSLAIIVSGGGGTTSTSITSIFEDGNVSNTATCSAYTRDKTGSVLTTGKSGGSPGAPVRAYYYFNLSSIPAGATMTNITLNISVDSVSSATSCQIYNLDTDNNTNTATTLWTDIGDGTNYVFNSDFCQTAGFKTINLGTNATGNTTNFNITKGWFGIGIPTNTSWGCSPASQPWSKFDASENSSYAPTLIVTYTTTSTDQISLINNTITSVPFYTNSTNPENTTSLNAGQSAVITYWVNATGENSTYYQFYAFANRTANMSVNTMINALNLTIEDVLTDTTLPYFTFIPANQTLELNVTGLSVDFSATDETGFGGYNISDKVNFSINSTGGVINLTKLTRMDYILNITINDTSNNINWTLFNVSVQDTRKPYFTLIPANATLEYKTTGLQVDFNASDDGVGFATYKIDDTTNFTINSTGGLINSTSLSLRTYTINVSINDTISLVNYTLYKVFVNDTTSPVYTSISNISIYTNQSVLGDYSATDLDTITWNLNDTTKFSINTTGDLINSTSLSAGVYYLIIYINDSSNNKVEKSINVTVLNQLDTTPPYFQNISNLLHYTNESVKMDFNATDETSFSSWATNNTANFSINSTGYFQNISTLTPGIIYINISINDTIGNLNSTIINVTTLRQVHNFPNIEIVFPTNNTNTTDTNLDVNYTRTDDFGIDSCWYSNNSGLNNYTLAGCGNITGTTWLEGLNNLTFWINDSDNNINSTKVSFRVDTIQPYLTENLNTQTREYKYQNLSYDINSSDSGVGVQCFAVNNTIRFSINCAGLLINATSLEIGNYFVNITFNDTLNNTNSTVLQVTIQDTTKPTITQPANATIELNVTGLGVDFDASDISNLGSWLINDTNFQINSSGWLKNLTMLINKTYFINVSINDTIGNINETLYQVIVSDTLKPYFNPLPVNQSIYTNQSLLYDINAFDDGVGFSNYFVNNTIQFSINTTGGLINITTLSITNYSINISINDSVGNLNSSVIVIGVSSSVIEDTTPPTFNNLRNFTHTINTSFSNSITASDNVAISKYYLNDTSNFNINSANGLITNATNLSILTIYYLNISVNDTSGNMISGIFWINVTEYIAPSVTSTPKCLYKHFGYYNLKLPWFREEGCI